MATRTITFPDGTVFNSTRIPSGAAMQTIWVEIVANMLGIIPIDTPLKTTASFVAGSPVATLPDGMLVQLYVGLTIVSSAIPDGTTILAIGAPSANQLTLSANSNNTVTDPNVQFYDSNAYELVRAGWQTQGQPSSSVNQDVCYVLCTPLDSPYSRLRDQHPLPAQGNTIQLQDIYTRRWKLVITFYGPNSLDNARAVESGLLSIPYVDYYLSSFNLYIDPSIDEPLRVPEEFGAGQWWERVDFSAEFNEQITETLTIGTVGSVEVKLYTKDGEIVDFTVTT